MWVEQACEIEMPVSGCMIPVSGHTTPCAFSDHSVRKSGDLFSMHVDHPDRPSISEQTCRRKRISKKKRDKQKMNDAQHLFVICISRKKSRNQPLNASDISTILG